MAAFAKKYGLKVVSFDQGECGHGRRKPTSLLTNLPGMDELQGLRCGKDEKGIEPLAADLPQRLEQTSSWSSWAPGLTQAIKESIKQMSTVGIKRLSLDEWRQHVRQNHTPYRRDCRLCVQEMGAGEPHRRRGPHHKGESAYCLSVDITGPFVTGWDYGTGCQARYGLLATVPIPVIHGGLQPKGDPLSCGDLPGPEVQPSGEVPRSSGDGSSEECLAGSCALGEKVQEGPAEPVPSIGDKVDGDALPADPLAPIPELGGDAPNPELPDEEDGELGEDLKKLGEKLNTKWREHMEEATAPFKIQNITLFEPLGSRASNEVLSALDRVWVRFRALGIPMVRLHSDRAKEMLSNQCEHGQDVVVCTRHLPLEMMLHQRYLGEVPEGSGADAEVKFRKVQVQKLSQVPDGSGAHTQVRIRKFPVQTLGEVPEGSGADPIGEVPEGSGADAEVRFRRVADARSGSGRLRCRYPGQDPEGSGTEVRFRRVQIPSEVPEGSGADSL